ncbi:AraC family transcriptional regulator [Variovorax sp. RB2P76]|uniref:AraC family transcriptional regulator n=1 Tax=Variovorax sp. RB2P76 TaxID=3443736 RepID=UPI003F46774E
MEAPARPRQLLDSFPLLRSRNLEEANESIGRAFSPHSLKLFNSGQLNVEHNQVCLRHLSLNVLHYGADVVIDQSERGDFYMVQLPQAGRAKLFSGGETGQVDTGMLSVLQPQVQSRMVWSSDCTMILLQVPCQVVRQRAIELGAGPEPRFSLTYSLKTPSVAAWVQAVTDLTTNIDRFGSQWLRHPAAYAAMEDFLLCAFIDLLCERGNEDRRADRGDERCLRRAKEYVHAHVDRALTSTEIARYACVCPRTLEAVFKRFGELSPMAYAREVRLQAAHETLRVARHEGRTPNVTEVAFAYGFLHMSRFAAQYRKKFGCSPSQTLKPH